MTGPIIAAHGLTKKFGSHTAVKQIQFEIQPSECFGFLGPNGAGKTSTLRMMYGLSPITAGNLLVFGKDMASHQIEVKRQMGVVPQEDSLDPDLTVLENLLVYANYYGISKKESLERAHELLAFLQLEEKKNARIPQLSGGMRRRLVITRALLHRPKILILDEPTTGLDPQARHVIWAKLRALKESGVTLVLTTHYLEEASQLCDRLVIMNEGQILAAGSPRELIQKYVGREVYEVRIEELTESNPLVDEVKKAGFQVEVVGETFFIFLLEGQELPSSILLQLKVFPFHHRMAALEDVFLKVAGRQLSD